MLTARDILMPATQREPVAIDLALQGGGSHGALTWGVLDRLLEEDWLVIKALSGTSAGAMNAAVLSDGFARDGAAGARAALEDFWRQVAEAARWSPLQRTPLDRMLGRWTLDQSPFFIGFELAARMVSPYEMNPAAYHPLRDILARTMDPGRLAASPIKVFVTATQVRTGRGKVFRNADICPEVLLASACLPTLFQAIEIDGEPYWDGGYVGNPTPPPLPGGPGPHDPILAHVTPVGRPGTPGRAGEIHNRLNEIAFNAPLLKELRMMALLRQVANPGETEGARWARMRMHRITSPLMTELGYSSKLNAEWEFLCLLRDEGRRSAEAFLVQHGEDLGRRSTLDLDSFLD